MKCPVDGETLLVAERSGVEIDYCPKCRGVWLDRGELDKIIDKAASMMAPADPVVTSARTGGPGPLPGAGPAVKVVVEEERGRPPEPAYGERRKRRDDDDDDDDDRRGGGYRRGDDDEGFGGHGQGRKRREGFLGELFDFF